MNDSTPASEIPTSVDHVPLEWISDALRATDVWSATSRLAGYRPQVLGDGRGLTGTVARLELEYASPEAGLPASLILKLSSTVEAYRDYCAAYGTYGREIRLYRDVAPRLCIRTPRCYRADLSDDGRVCALLLEDFPEHRAGDQIAGCSLSDARLAIKVAAQLHASNWGLAEIPPGFDPANGAMGARRLAVVPTAWATMVDKFRSLIPRAVQDAGEVYTRVFSRLQAWARTGALTHIHGDYRLDNLLFAPATDATEVVLIDWQGTTVGRGMVDIAYFMTQSLPPADRRAWQDELLTLYRIELANHGVIVDADSLRDELRTAALYMLAFVASIAVYNPTDPRGRLFVRTCVERGLATVADFELLELLDSLA